MIIFILHALAKSFQVYSKAEPSKYTRTEGKLNGEGSFQDKVDIWKPLNCLVEAANRTKSFRSSQHSPVVKAEQTNGPASEVDGNSIRVKERPHKSEVQEQKSKNNPMPPEMLKAGSLQGINQQTRNLTAVAQTPLDAGITQCVRSIGPIWFSLVAAVEQLTKFLLEVILVMLFAHMYFMNINFLILF